MKYSIIIPTLTKDIEHWEVLEECLDSVHANSTDYELILIDDGGHFHHPAYDENAWRSYCDFDILIEHDTNKGIPISWNDGIKIARGEYLAIINDDITVQEGWLDKLRMALEDDDDNMVAAPGVIGKHNGTGIEEDYQWFPGYCFMVRKEITKEFPKPHTIGLFDEQFSPFNYEDTDYWTRVLQSGGKLVRNYATMITHREGHVLHTLEYEKVSNENKAKFTTKHGFDPIPVFYEGAKAPWETVQ